MNKSTSSLIIDLIVEIKKNFLNYHSDSSVPILYLLIFKILDKNHETRVSDLAKILGISKPSITEIVQKMERGGIIYKECGKDKREKFIYLTDKGNKKKKEYKDNFQFYIDSKIRQMSVKDRNIFEKDIKEIVSVLKK